MMTKNELIKLSEHEIQWLRYYSTRDSRSDLINVENLYIDLNRMKYSKRQMTLHGRCSAAMITFDREINSSVDVSDVYIVTKERKIEDNIFTPLEVLIKLYPNMHEYILYMLKNLSINPSLNLKNF